MSSQDYQNTDVLILSTEEKDELKDFMEEEIEYLETHPNTRCNKCSEIIYLDEDVQFALIDIVNTDEKFHLCCTCHTQYQDEMTKD